MVIFDANFSFIVSFLAFIQETNGFEPYSIRIRKFFEKYPGAMQAWDCVKACHYISTMCFGKLFVYCFDHAGYYYLCISYLANWSPRFGVFSC
jgi:hypothetical protein